MDLHLRQVEFHHSANSYSENFVAYIVAGDIHTVVAAETVEIAALGADIRTAVAAGDSQTAGPADIHNSLAAVAAFQSLVEEPQAGRPTHYSAVVASPQKDSHCSALGRQKGCPSQCLG